MLVGLLTDYGDDADGDGQGRHGQEAPEQDKQVERVLLHVSLSAAVGLAGGEPSGIG